MASFSTVKVTTSVILVCLLQSLGTNSAPIKGSEKKIICYYKIASFYKTQFIPENLDASLCTHIICDFGNLNQTTFKLDCANRFLDIDQGFYQRTTSLKMMNPNLKVLLGMGGWVDSTEKYSVLVSHQEKRANFINSSISFLKQYGFDGLDINWEYPNCWQGICGCKPSDKQNFVIFLQELRAAYEPLCLTLSVSVAAAKWEIDQAYDVPAVSAAVDFINVMCYDFHGPWEDSTGHHSQFHPRPNDKYPSLNMKTAMNYYAQLGAEKKKLIVGIPSYGTTFTLKNTEHFGFGSSSRGVGRMGNFTQEGGMLSYFEICHYVNYHGWTEVEEGNTGTYAYKHDQWVGYDSPFAAASKARFIIENDFGGVVIKSIDTDDYEGICSSLTYPIIRALKYGFANQLDEKCHDTKSLIICIKNEMKRNSKNEMDTEDNMPKEREESSTPLVDTRQKHPQGTTTPQHPQETTTPQHPQETTTPQHPQETTTPQYLQETTIPQYLQETTTPQYLQETTTPQYLQETTTPQPPQETTTPQPPQETTTPQYLQETTTPQPPQETTTPQPPQETTTPQPPQETTTPQHLQETTTPQHLQETTTPQHLQETTTPQRPQETTTPRYHQETTTSQHPPETTTSQHPQETTTPQHPQETTTSQHPQETTTPQHPQETTTPQHPQETTTPQHPQETTTPQHPQETTTPQYLQETTTPQYLQETTTPQHLQETTTPQHPPETTTSQHPQETTTPQHPQETTTPEYPQETTTSQHPQETTTPQPPQETTTPQHLQETTTPQHLQETTTPQHLQETTTPQRPQETTTPRYHQETTTSQHPPETTTSQHPQETTTPQHPQETTTPQHPQETTTPQHPQETTTPQHPQETTTPQHPQETTTPQHPQETTTPQCPQETTTSQHPEETTTPQQLQITPAPYAQTTETMVTESFHSQAKGVSAPSNDTKNNEQEEPSKHHAPTSQHYPQERTSHPYSQVTPAPDSTLQRVPICKMFLHRLDGKKDITEQENPLKHHPEIGTDQYHPPGTTEEYHSQVTTAKYSLQNPTSQYHPQRTTPTPYLQSAETTVADRNKKPTFHPSRIPRSKKRSPHHNHKPNHRKIPVGKSPSKPLNSADNGNEISNRKNGSHKS